MNNTIETMRSYKENQVNSGFLNARYELEFPPGVPMLLNDINGLLRSNINPKIVDDAVTILIGTTYKPESVLYLTASALSETSEEIVQSSLLQLSPENTAVLWPGDGSIAVLRETLRKCDTLATFPSFNFPTRRIVTNGKPTGVEIVISDTDLQDLKQMFKTYIIIDDVIATGITLNTIRQRINENAGEGKTFKAITWLLRNPTQIEGYQNVSSVFRYWTPEGWPALNSLSTLLRNDEKGEIVREYYKRKYVKYPYGFKKQLQYIRDLTTLGGTL